MPYNFNKMPSTTWSLIFPLYTYIISTYVQCSASFCDGTNDGDFFQHESSCFLYYRCSHGDAVEYQCAPHTAWDQSELTCVGLSGYTCTLPAPTTPNAVTTPDDDSLTSSTTTILIESTRSHVPFSTDISQTVSLSISERPLYHTSTITHVDMTSSISDMLSDVTSVTSEMSSVTSETISVTSNTLDVTSITESVTSTSYPIQASTTVEPLSSLSLSADMMYSTSSTFSLYSTQTTVAALSSAQSMSLFSSAQSTPPLSSAHSTPSCRSAQLTSSFSSGQVIITSETATSSTTSEQSAPSIFIQSSSTSSIATGLITTVVSDLNTTDVADFNTTDVTDFNTTDVADLNTISEVITDVTIIEVNNTKKEELRFFPLDPDERVSAQAIGWTAWIIIFLLLGVILVLDASTLYKHLLMLKRNIFGS
ncbi:unnamed protein product [Owenia fusiformis]|uniref:Uncharacterized protein n=1 Tax=Owenia fusiformis TaxID=6347 RepID=A0A8J1TFH6_OWEFU|nr:unnamed protein product [Owenia fusiformis]